MSTDLLKLTAYFGERSRGERGFLADELLDLFGRAEVADSVVLRGIGGFGPSHQLRTDRTLSHVGGSAGGAGRGGPRRTHPGAGRAGGRGAVAAVS